MKKLACMLLSLLFILPLASAYGVTFYNPTMNPQDGTLFEKVDQGKLYDVIIDKDGIDLRKVSFKVNKDSTTAGITVYHLVAVPPILPELESTYETLEFRYGGFATHEVTHLRFEFRVAKDWLSDQSVPRDTVAMHWHDEMLDAWEPLSTKITGEDGSYVYYSASLDQGARYFAVAKSASGEKAEAPAPAPQKVVASEPVKPAPAPAEPEVVVQPEPAPVAAPAPTPQPAAVPQPQHVGGPATVDIAPEEKG
ncbi:TPA: PGF-pre-PGF domain-containing protein, partial [Candidatus Woesearchaeota archaeon]|nr:PGF-pre-PGF domain-containing protein [Candidatus Woesearchaeota archaeon]